MNNRDNGDQTPEFQVSIEPRFDQLAARGLTLEEFESRVGLALDEFYSLLLRVANSDDVPALEEIEIDLDGERIPLGELADVSFSAESQRDAGFDTNRT
jgi:hypothetical protein